MSNLFTYLDDNFLRKSRQQIGAIFLLSFFTEQQEYSPVFGLNTEIYGVNLLIQTEYKKLRTRKNSVF